MTDKEAEQLLDWLTGCFGKRLEDNERFVWLSTLVELDAGRAMEIALQIGKGGERFPSVPEFRRAMRSIESDESWRDLPPEALPVPEWVNVWLYSLTQRGDEHRPFPQFIPAQKNAMTMTEYEEIRKEWKEAGSPHISSMHEIVSQV